jgi:hypothetical protein
MVIFSAIAGLPAGSPRGPRRSIDETDHDVRNSTAGLIRNARRDGIHVANAPMPAMSSTGMAKMGRRIERRAGSPTRPHNPGQADECVSLRRARLFVSFSGCRASNSRPVKRGISLASVTWLNRITPHTS